MRLHFGPFVLEVDEARLRREGVPVPAQPLVIDVIRFFAERPGQLVTREELLSGVWPGVRVSDQTLSQAVRRARKVLGDDADQERWIETVARRGYRFAADVRAESAPAPAPSPVMRASNLPATIAEIVGREEELAQLSQRLYDGEPVLTLVGPGGIGKTLLALHAARRSGFEICFVDLSTARDADGVVAAFGAALGVRVDSEPSLALATALGQPTVSTKRLVLLDNAEHVLVPVASLVSDLLKIIPQGRFLVTSREVLRIASEGIMAVSGLSVEAGTELFMRCQAARGQQALPEQYDTIRAIVTALDGIPLAIELAAARTGLLTPADILARLDQPLALLSKAPRDVASRHATMRAALQWSWDLLSPEECDTLRALAVFRGSFSLEAAEAVLGGRPGAIDLVQSLVDKSWVVASGQGRLILWRIARTFAAERRDLVALERHAAYYGALGLRLHERDLANPSYNILLDALLERDELLAAVERATDPDDAAGALLGLWRLLQQYGPHSTLVSSLLSLDKRQLSAPLRVRVDRLAGNTLPAADGGPLLERAYEGALSLGDLPLAAVLALNCGVVRHRSDTSLARAWFQRAKADLPDTWQGIWLSEFASLLLREDRFAEARAHFIEAEQRLDSEGNHRVRAIVLGNLGLVDIHTGRYPEARQWLEEALDLSRAGPDPRLEGMVRGYLGDLCRASGRRDEAICWQTDAIALHRRVGNVRFLAMEQLSLAETMRDAGENSSALSTLLAAMPAIALLKDKRAEGIAKSLLAELQPADRAQTFDEAEALLASVEARYDLALSHCARVRVALREGRPEEALSWLDRAGEIARSLETSAESELGRWLVALRGELSDS